MNAWLPHGDGARLRSPLSDLSCSLVGMNDSRKTKIKIEGADLDADQHAWSSFSFA